MKPHDTAWVLALPLGGPDPLLPAAGGGGCKSPAGLGVDGLGALSEGELFSPHGDKGSSDQGLV